MPKIGVYICHCGTNISGKVNVDEILEAAKKFPYVEIVRDYKFMCSDPGQDLIHKDIEELKLDRVVVSSCSPLMHEQTFRKVCEQSGLNKYLFSMSNIREQCSWVTVDSDAATDKAKALVCAAVARAGNLEPLETKMVPINPATLVVGGGIAGIEAALQIADSGNKVYLVEREPYIGGNMAKFDKTFPTLDCAACILTPKMVNVGQHENIELTYSDVKEVAGYIGNFTVKINKRSKYVDEKLCTGCSDCEAVCPVATLNEFEEGLVERKAIYRAFPQAVPGTYTIDRKGSSPCKHACPAETSAQGYIALIRNKKYKEALDLNRRVNPFPGICGRVCDHPCEAECERGDVDEPISICHLKRFVSDWALENDQDNPEPVEKTHSEKVAVIGSGPAGLAAAYQLAKKGFPVTVFEALPVAGGMMTVGIPSFRLPRDIINHEIDYIKALGVEIKTNTAIGKDIKFEDLKKQFNAIFVATGAHIGAKLRIPGEESDCVVHAIDFLRKVNLGEKVFLGDKVGVIGGGNAAMDAVRTAIRTGSKEVMIIYRRSRKEMPANEAEILAAEHEGVQIRYLEAPLEVIPKEGGGCTLKCIKMELGEPDESGRRRPVPIEGSEFNIELDTLIPAISQDSDCSFLPKDIPLNKWGAVDADKECLAANLEEIYGKGKEGKEGEVIPHPTTKVPIFAGGDVVVGPQTVILAISHGNRVAENIDKYFSGLDLRTIKDEREAKVEDVLTSGIKKAARINMPELPAETRRTTFDEVDTGYTEAQALQEAERCLNCAICSDCQECEKVCEPIAIKYDMKDQEIEVEVGNIIVATGYKQFDATRAAQYGYKKYPNVITGLEFERMNSATGPTDGEILLENGEKPKSVAILHCIGSRDANYNEYCSRVCCMYSMKFAHLVKDRIDAEVYELYIDMRSFGKGYEEFYNRILREDIRVIRGKGAEVTNMPIFEGEEGKLIVRCEDTLIGQIRRIPVDMVVLATGLESAKGADEVARLFTISRGKDGFFIEKHPKLAPVATTTDGVFIAGCCQGPKDIPDAVAQGAAAASGVLSLIARGEVEIDAATAWINPDLCSGCKTCNELCPYNAITFNAEASVSEINEALCKGCGTCVAACPSSAIVGRHFSDEQIFAEIEGIMAE